MLLLLSAPVCPTCRTRPGADVRISTRFRIDFVFWDTVFLGRRRRHTPHLTSRRVARIIVFIRFGGGCCAAREIAREYRLNGNTFISRTYDPVRVALNRVPTNTTRTRATGLNADQRAKSRGDNWYRQRAGAAATAAVKSIPP